MLAASVTRQEPEQTGYADVAGGRIGWRMAGARHRRSDRAVGRAGRTIIWNR